MKTSTIVIFTILVMLLFVAGPLVLIWSLNSLFGSVGLDIPYTWQTWLAMLITLLALRGGAPAEKKSTT